jgi:hypothetical protein
MQLNNNQLNKILYAARLNRQIKELKTEYDKIKSELIGEFGEGYVTDMYNRPLMRVFTTSARSFDPKNSTKKMWKYIRSI